MAPRSKINVDVTDDPGHFDEAIRFFEKKLPMPAEEFETLIEAEKEFAFTVANVTQADVVDQVYQEVLKAVKEGTTLEEFKKAVTGLLEDEWGAPEGGRVETIFRTNLNSAYNAGRYAIYTAPAVKQSRPYWRFEGVEDDRQSDVCAEIGQPILPADDPFWEDHIPPLHFNCRSTITALDEEEAAEEGVADEAPDVEAEDGFGGAPSEEGEDWKPDPGDYAEEIGDALRGKLEGG